MKSIFILLILSLFTSEAISAEIIAQPKAKGNGDFYYADFAIEGKIKQGDYEKFIQMIRRYGSSYNTIRIASKGGDIFEAMKIGRLIRRLNFGVIAPYNLYDGSNHIYSFDVKDKTNDVCASACFFIYIAGVKREGSIIGIHRPYLSAEQYKNMGIDDAMTANRKLKTIVNDYLNEMGVPIDYADRMFAISKDKIEWLERSEIDKRFTGYIPDIDEWINAQCPKMTDTEMIFWESIKNRRMGALSKSEKTMFKSWHKKNTSINNCKENVHKRVSCDKWEEFWPLNKSQKEWLVKEQPCIKYAK